MKKSLQFILFILIAFLPGIFGSFFKPGLWYETLSKPSFTPPGWIFGPVWTMLYITIGISGYLAWQATNSFLKRNAFIVYTMQLILNGLWSWIFFGLHNIEIALILIIILWMVILINTVLFTKLKKVSGLLLLPYLLWVSFATLLNWSFFYLNS